MANNNEESNAAQHVDKKKSSSSAILSDADAEKLLASAIRSEFGSLNTDADGHFGGCGGARVCPCAVGIFFDPTFLPERCLCGIACEVMPTVRQLSTTGAADRVVRLCPDGNAVLATGALASDLLATWPPTPGFRLVAMQKTCMLAHMPVMYEYLRVAAELRDAALPRSVVVDRVRADQYEIVFGVARRGAAPDLVAHPLAATGALLDLLGLEAAERTGAADTEAAAARAALFARLCPDELARHPAFIKGTAPHNVLRLQFAAQTALRDAAGALVAAKGVVDLFYSVEDGVLRVVCFKFADFVVIEPSASPDVNTFALNDDDAAVFFSRYPGAPSAPLAKFSNFEDQLVDDSLAGADDLLAASSSTAHSEAPSPATTAQPADGTNTFPLFWDESDLESMIGKTMISFESSE